jgi:murein DD-endopeptidase MepM/ murein hydrolase activator NlpD
MEIDFQTLISKLQLKERFGEGPLAKIWEELQKIWPGLFNNNFSGDNGSDSPNISKIPVEMPVNGEIVAQYGLRVHPVYGDERMHTGIDFACAEGEPIKAVLDGVVIKVEESPTYGKTVFLDHENGLKTFYAHCSKILVTENQQVKAKETIAEVGNTGLSTNPHLHFEVWKEDVSVDPNAVFTFFYGGD